MPVLVDPFPIAPHYEAAPVTEELLDYAELPIVDLSDFADSSLENRSKLVKQVCQAISKYGFFYVVNHGFSSAQTRRMFDIGDVAFSQVDEAEKQRYPARLKETGSYQGYKPRQYYHVENGVRDEFEIYSMNRDVNLRQHPNALRPFLPEIEQFARHNHTNVLHPLLRLLALGLELPESTFVDIHRWEGVSESYVRFMKYYPRSEEDEKKSNNLWMKGHTDIGSLTLLYSQPVSALQIRTKDGGWKWLRHVDNAIVVFTGDAMEFMSGGLFRPTVHRVVQPPSDQRAYTRLGANYFALPDDDIELKAQVPGPVLQRLGDSGVQRRFDDAEAPTMEEWRKARTSAYGQTELKAGTEKGEEEEYLNGVLVKHYT